MRRALLFLTLMLFSAVIAETTVTVFKTTAEKEYLIPLKVV